MSSDFLVARNPDADSSLPYLLRVPLGAQGVVLKAKQPWPRTSKVYTTARRNGPRTPKCSSAYPCARAHVAVRLPSRRAAGQVLSILVDSGEKYAYTFSHQQASTERRRLSAGD